MRKDRIFCNVKAEYINAAVLARGTIEFKVPDWKEFIDISLECGALEKRELIEYLEGKNG